MVSIRSRPAGREIPLPIRISALPSSGFNPLPARRPGDTIDRASVAATTEVSIRSRPAGREVQPEPEYYSAESFVSIRSRPAGREIRNRRRCACRRHPVSIRSRPAGREIPLTAPAWQQCSMVSIRSRPAGREIQQMLDDFFDPSKFQSAPGPQAGRYIPTMYSSPVTHIVSIRSRPAGREIHSLVAAPLQTHLFQSAPGPQAGRYHALPNFGLASPVFQSAPGPQAGRYTGMMLMLSWESSFNPLPARRPGDTLVRMGVVKPTDVSIRSRPAGREILNIAGC